MIPIVYCTKYMPQ